MKTFLYMLLTLAVFVLAAIITKPSDTRCIALIKEREGIQVYGDGGVGDLINTLTDSGGLLIYQVDDQLICKEVTNRITGRTVAVIWFGFVIMN